LSIAGFQARSLGDISQSADLEIGDTADLEISATGETDSIE
jgi:hypothetical protein